MKRANYLRDLSSEHHQALGLARQIIRSYTDGADIQSMIDKVKNNFNTEIVPHFVHEEETVLPELSRLGKHDLVDRTLQEHSQMRNLIADLHEPLALLQFAEILKAHVRFEERILFPTCQEIFDDEAILTIDGKNNGFLFPPDIAPLCR